MMVITFVTPGGALNFTIGLPLCCRWFSAHWPIIILQDAPAGRASLAPVEELRGGIDLRATAPPLGKEATLQCPASAADRQESTRDAPASPRLV